MHRHTAALFGATLSALLAPARAEAAATPDCRPAPAREDVLDGVGPRGELVLGSGDRAVLSGLRWPEAAEAVAAGVWLTAYRGRRLILVRRGEPDRWGRARVDAAVADAPVDLAGGLVAAGLAPVDAGEADALCRPALLTLEDGARAARRGIWQAPVRDARDGPALAAETGRFVVAEGRVVNVGERPARTYLDFVRRGETGLTVTVSKRTWRLLGNVV